MQNNTYPVRQVLINSLTVKDFGYYTHTDPDTAVTTRHLILKKYGIDIPMTPSDSSLVTTVTKGVTTSGILKSVLLQTNGPAPCYDCYYDYAIEVVKKVKRPGVLNDDYYKKGRQYGGVINAIQAPVNGQLTDTDKLSMEDTIITAVANDQATNLTTREPSVAHVKRLYILTVAIGGSNGQSLTWTLANGTTATVSLDAYATTALMAAALNAASFGTYLTAVAKSTTELIIFSVNPEVLFYFSDGGNTVAVTDIKRYMWFYAKDVNAQFELRFHMGVFTRTLFNLLQILNTGTQSGNTTLYVGGSILATVANHDTSSTYAASFNSNGTIGTAVTGLYASAETAGSDKPVYIYTGEKELRIASYGYAGITTGFQYSGQGVYPNMTSDDIFQIFMKGGQNGKQAIYGYIDQPVDGAKYTKLRFKTLIASAGAIHGASHRDLYEGIVEVFIIQGLGTSGITGTNNIWYATNYMWETTADGAAFTANAALNDLLTAWYGSSLTVL